MTVLVVGALGAAAGMGLWWAYRALWPQPAPLGQLLRQAEAAGRPLSAQGQGVEGRPWKDRAAQLALWLADRLGVWTTAEDLRLAGTTRRQQALRKTGWAAVGAVVPLLWTAAGLMLSPAMLAVAVGVGAAVGWLLPDRRGREEAAQQRRGLRDQFIAYLRLVDVIKAGGAQDKAALHAAAAAGEGWVWEMIREGLVDAERLGRRPWEVFQDLGEQLDVDELTELASSLSLVSEEGATVRDTLAARADTLGAYQLAETRARAEAATERMTLPLVAMAIGFFLAALYPLLWQFTTVTGGNPTPLP